MEQLIARIASLKTEKQAVVAAVEIEEEHITNTLQKQARRLRPPGASALPS